MCPLKSLRFHNLEFKWHSATRQKVLLGWQLRSKYSAVRSLPRLLDYKLPFSGEISTDLNLFMGVYKTNLTKVLLF